MNLPALAVRRPVAVAALWTGVLALGALAAVRMPLSVLPETPVPWITVRTQVPASTAEEVERRVTAPIEEALAGLPGRLRTESASRDGESLVVAIFPWGSDLSAVRLEARERIDRLAALPEGAARPDVRTDDPRAVPLATARMRGRVPPDELRAMAEAVVRRRLEALDGVARVDVLGGAFPEVEVAIDPARAEARGVGIDAVVTALERATASAPAGTGRIGERWLPVRGAEPPATLDELAGVVVARAADGTPTRLGAVARLRTVAVAEHGAVLERGRPALALRIHDAAGGALAAARETERTVRRTARELRGVEIEIASSRAGRVSSAIRGALAALAAGAVLSFVVLLPILRDPRWPAIVALAMPTSVAGALVALRVSGASLDAMSLGGLALGMGMVVDASIVGVERIVRRREEGMAPALAAATGVRDVQGGITAATITTVVAFLPLAAAGGLAGALFGELALATSASLLVSLAVAVTLVPAAAARVRARPAARPGASERLLAKLEAVHARALARTLDHPRTVLAAAGAFLAVSALVAVRAPREVLSEPFDGDVVVRFAAPPGTPVERTAAIAGALERWLRERRDVRSVLVRVGRAAGAGSAFGASHDAALDVGRAPGADPSATLAGDLRRAARSLPLTSLAVEPAPADDGAALVAAASPPVAIVASGDAPEALAVAADTLERRLSARPDLVVTARPAPSRPVVRVAFDRAALAARGLDPDGVAAALRDRTRGRPAGALANSDAGTPIVVRWGAPPRDLAELLADPVAGAPLGTLVRASEAAAPSEIARVDGRRVARFEVEAVRGGTSAAARAAREAIAGWSPPAGVDVGLGGATVETRGVTRTLGRALALAVALVALVLVARFESLGRPLIVLTAVPLALSGAVLALVACGRGLDAPAGIGLLALVGLAVTDTILEVDAVDRQRATGASPRRAAEIAARQRLRPILMTALTTILGVVPLALGLGAGGALRAPLAIAVMGGLVTCVAQTLLVLPALIVLLPDRG